MELKGETDNPITIAGDASALLESPVIASSSRNKISKDINGINSTVH